MALKIKELTKSFGTSVIIDNFSYEFPERGIVAVTGKSGVGKTTLLRMIAGLDTRYSGEIVGGGLASCSFAFQEYRLFDQLSLIDNVLVAKEKTTNDDAISASARLYRLGFETRDLKLRPAQLSGGIKQRAALARAIMKNSPILLLDEPTKEIDELPIRNLYSILHELSRERLIIFTSHRQEDVDELADLIIEL
jgi:ABC-type multidrug transport system ATPase subunit